MRATRNSTTSSVSDLRTDTPPLTLGAVQTGAPASAPVSHGLPDHDVSAEGLTKSFGKTQIFSDVNFRLVRGEAVALVGANGTGKSTLLRCILGLIPIDGGTVELLGQDVSAAKASQMRQLRSKTGLVAQKHNLVPRLTVLSNVLHGLLGQQSGPRYWSQSFAPQAARDAALAALDKVGLAHLAGRRADRLSGGQSQRVAIARALIAQPKLLIADEPCASLDPSAGEEIMSMFFDLVRSEGVTVVFTSHHIEHALTYGDRVLGLAEGKLKLDATANSLAPSDLRGLYD
ncbi:phosphonate transport system ATP-binding protein [Aliiroseovarius halocynthiae]|uniref:ATP-binding cassette domain-containing protein n=1 Tax=Aliiroseovarius halocynthiae TaxID=985055 RepID=A0A545SQW9_9RHOB|nr:ATP-binding cassette domain-containing protein [Aliiroseovarius halocynthiae]SMR81256.1 phosphonate transport system ATP-binding protein [Aliiroseovarius halocynthiae]